MIDNFDTYFILGCIDYHLNDASSLNDRIWTCSNTMQKQASGQEPAGAFGIYELIGNQSEWFGDSLYDINYAPSEIILIILVRLAQGPSPSFIIQT